MTYTPYIPPSRAWSAPPVHAETIINVIYTDGDFDRNIRAGNISWSDCETVNTVLGYEVVEEYREPPKPREWWINSGDGGNLVILHDSYKSADRGRRNFRGEVVNHGPIIHVREVLE